ncbi:TetR/AcrR family transcriptional regulator [Paenibacillus sp. HN-1]|uniref:TetR/AcrR family transcriptional regulator n=2 Tax=Paenibacillus TaxID=44249 RepID=UPI001CAA286B|nr:TetR/AcrR family transcriptional regulator [Paenibacillus sp. CGMCC 1.18879]MBY9080679.1 TetR/AcrR family transcriptional regulator [Paenibacillus sp. CGMCC 1.18879]MBY9085376.1 TetR/AcrR family transcriptional regulator [Paenibacillus sinensis]
MSPKKLNSRQLQSMQTKKEIYNSALRLMKTKDLEAIKIGEICKEAGVSVGSFYNYFKTKSDILVEMYEQADSYFDEKYKGVSDSRDAKEELVRYFEVYADYNENMGLETIKQLYTTNNKLFIAKGRYMQTTLQGIIEKRQASGELDNQISSEEITEFLFIAARGVIYNWCLHDGDFNLIVKMKQYMERLVSTFQKQ